jgi:hypothetical protein
VASGHSMHQPIPNILLFANVLLKRLPDKGSRHDSKPLSCISTQTLTDRDRDKEDPGWCVITFLVAGIADCREAKGRPSYSWL